MFMYERLSVDEREQLLSVLTADQRDFLENEVKRGRRTVFENFMRDEKITALRLADEIKLEEDEMNVVDWMISDFDDFGPGNYGGQCACGRRLRYMFTVEHQKTGKKIQYGKQHLSTFLNIEVKDIDGYINELDVIDNELDELLWKIKDDQYYHEYYERLLDQTVVSESIKKHLELNVPFLDSQVNRLKKHFETQMEALEEEQQKIQREVDFEKRQAENKRIEELLREKKKIEDKLEAARKVQAEAECSRQQQKKEREERIAQEKIEKDTELVKATKAQLAYGATFEDIAYSLVLNGQHSAVAISQMLANDFGFDQHMSVSTMDRLFLYYDVLLALKKQVDHGNLIMDESSSVEDCIFYVNPFREEERINETEEVEQQTLALF
ncbi:cell envelope integrity protein TolA [Lysinibacillus sp. NPDC097287]|uniref:cell envelope integrity protein TolA n=1 Tax=Lysinibacillus sp. NPDC097287 TaxID=3364144 RepID=UPI003808902D